MLLCTKRWKCLVIFVIWHSRMSAPCTRSSLMFLFLFRLLLLFCPSLPSPRCVCEASRPVRWAVTSTLPPSSLELELPPLEWLDLVLESEPSLVVWSLDMQGKKCYQLFITQFVINCYSWCEFSSKDFVNLTCLFFLKLFFIYLRNPSLKQQLFSYAILGFALSEAMGLFCLMVAFLILFAM